MAYLALARKWRPQNFARMVGQEHVVRALINALDSDQLHHAYLFTGTRGVGKTTIARIFAKSLNCEIGVSSEPCGKCSACREIDDGRFIDLIEVDAASRTKVDDTRELLDNVQYSPSRGRYKVYLIDEVHMLSKHSFNALLKTLEEPPPHVKFLLATTDPQQLPATVLSRCLQFNLKRLPAALIEQRLSEIAEAEAIKAEKNALRLLAGAAAGSVRDALSLMDQATAYGGGRITESEVRSLLGTMPREQVEKLLHAIATRDGVAVLRRIEEMDELAPDYEGVLGDMMAMLKEIAVAQIVPGDAEISEGIVPLVSLLTPEDVQLFFDIAVRSRASIEALPDPRAAFEMIMIRMLAFMPGADAGPPDQQKTTRSKIDVAMPNSGTGESAAKASADIAATNASDWGTLIDTLLLTGAARQLAANCELTRQDDRNIWLRLAATAESLLTDQLKGRLQKSLSRHFDRPIRLHIEIGETRTETLANRLSREAIERQRIAEKTIAEDPNVAAMKDAFGASIQEGSVQPLD